MRNSNDIIGNRTRGTLLIATFVSASAYKRSFMTVDVSFVPSCPAKGESLTLIVIAIVGGSTVVELISVVNSDAAIVSETEAFSSPYHFQRKRCGDKLTDITTKSAYWLLA